ncbi:MAG: hypothetical protein ACSLE5_05485 [Porticoccaceae bacterium]
MSFGSLFICKTEGISHVFVNRTLLVHNNQLTGETPGTIMRSGGGTTALPRLTACFIGLPFRGWPAVAAR